jgi:hypothetical protein
MTLISLSDFGFAVQEKSTSPQVRNATARLHQTINNYDVVRVLVPVAVQLDLGNRLCKACIVEFLCDCNR